jgi:transcriptional regulator with XRE-family HTH domain
VLLGIVAYTLGRLQEDIEVTVGNRIQVLRREKGFTQDEFALRAGLNRTHLYRLESGKQSVTLRTLKIVADALDVKISDLVKGI